MERTFNLSANIENGFPKGVRYIVTPNAKKFSLLTAFLIEAVECIEYAVARLPVVQLTLQEGNEVAVIAYNI